MSEQPTSTGKDQKRGASRDPRKQAVRHAMERWLKFPTEERLRASLLRAINHYELVARCQRAIPEAEPQRVEPTEIPVEEITFTNPNHRTTREEFLADCSTYGV